MVLHSFFVVAQNDMRGAVRKTAVFFGVVLWTVCAKFVARSAIVSTKTPANLQGSSGSHRTQGVNGGFASCKVVSDYQSHILDSSKVLNCQSD
jgi:hypothetical protein